MLEQIEVDLKAALLAGKQLDVQVLKALKNSLIIFEKDKGYKPSDDEAVRLVQKEIKKRLEAAQIYTKAGAQERADKEEKEAQVLKAYMPQQLSEEEIEDVVEQVIAENNIDSPQKMGMAIGLANKQIGARADGATIAAIVKKKLGV